MPAKSQAQRNLMGMALAVRNGKMKPDEVPGNVRQQVRKLAGDDSVDLEGFARTKEKGLPGHVKTNDGRARTARVRYA